MTFVGDGGSHAINRMVLWSRIYLWSYIECTHSLAVLVNMADSYYLESLYGKYGGRTRDMRYLQILLRTRCGCEKVVELDHDCGPVYREPLPYRLGDLSQELTASAIMPTAVMVRTFIYDGEFKDHMRVYHEAIGDEESVQKQIEQEQQIRAIDLD